MNKILIALFYFILFLSSAQAQINDAQFWENINLEKNISPKLIVRLIQQGRLTENFTRPSFNYFDLGLNYKLNKYIHFSLAYVWIERLQVNDFWSTRYQAYANITLRKKVKNLQINDRSMIQWQVKNYYTSENGHNADYYLRNKITITYEKYFKIQPYLAAEIYYRVNQPYDYLQYHFSRTRYFGGLFLRKNLTDEFEAYYLIERFFNTKNPPHNWIIGLGYTHHF